MTILAAPLGTAHWLDPRPPSMILFGHDVIVDPRLPGPKPTPGEDARRIVRHAMDPKVMKWLGQDPGLKPGERLQMILDGRTLYVSYDVLWSMRATLDPFSQDYRALGPDPQSPVVRAFRKAHTTADYLMVQKVGVFLTDEEVAR